MPPIDHPELGLPESMKADLAKAGARRGPGLGSADGGDRSSLRLHDADEQLIARAAAASDRVVVAVMGGSAVVMPWLERVPAALVLWYPGMEGGHAFADVLTGAVEPGGRLPFAIPLRESDLVPFDKDATAETYGLLHGQWHLDATGVTAQLPFGHGLGFTSFEFEAAKRDGEGVQVDVRNTGEREGSSVVQVYASVPTSRYERPPRRLVGFQRVSAGPGAATSVRIPIDRAQLDVREGGSWLREDAPVVLHAGFDAAHLVEVA